MQKALIIKIVVIVLIALLLFIPISMILEKIWERNAYLEEAKAAVSQSWTGDQNIMGPIIAIPYEVEIEVDTYNQADKTMIKKMVKRAEVKFLLPHSLQVTSKIENEFRHKGIYKVPVYSTLIDISGEIDNKYIQAELANINASKGKVTYGQAYLLVTVSDPRGIDAIPHLRWGTQNITFLPGSKLVANVNGIHALIPDFLNKEKYNSATTSFDFQIELRGMEKISFVPVAQEVSVEVASTWPHPEFIGKFLPNEREISAAGYLAKWKITSFASNIIEKVNLCELHKCDDLYSSYFGIKHIEAVDVYLQSERSVKYSMLFIGLTFIAFFMFEILKKLRIHPIQYTLVGLVIAVFYLMLFSLSEHISFGLSYLTSAMCCASLMLFYLNYVLGGLKQAVIFASMMLLLYAMLYVIISAEDYALLMGTALIFVTLTVIVTFTRKIDWYQATEQAAQIKVEGVQVK